MRRFYRLSLLGALAVLLLSLMLFAHERRAEGATGSTAWAVVVGLNNYFSPDVPALGCAVNDSRMMRRTLVDACGFAERNVLLLNTEDWGKDASTRVNIESCVKGLIGKVAPNDMVIFFFSGHGIEMDGEHYLVTFEANPESAESLQATCLKTSDLRGWLKDTHSSQVLVFADACRADPRAGTTALPAVAQGDGLLADVMPPMLVAALSPDALAKTLVVEVTPGQAPRAIEAPRSDAPSVEVDGSRGLRLGASFLSCDHGQKSYEWAEKRMGYYTYFVTAGLRGAAEDGRGNITLSSLHRYLTANVPQTVQAANGKQQTPCAYIQGSRSADSFALSTKETRVAAAVPEIAPRPGIVRPRPPGTRLKIAVDVIGNNVEGRSYNVLTHRIEEHFYEVDKTEIRRRLMELLGKEPTLLPVDNEKDADVWLYLNVCPTQTMHVDLLVRDRESGTFIHRQNESVRRPYPGKKEQLAELSLKLVRERMQKSIVDKVKASYGI